jgi:hypothetical protein
VNNNATPGRDLDTIECGSANAVLRVDSDGIGTAVFGGLMVPANFLAIGVLTMREGVARGARGLLYRVEQAAVCCDPVSMTASYPNLAPALRALPVAFVVNAGQAELYEHVVKRAAAAGLMRRVFRDESEARAWLQRTLQALGDNRAWWGTVRGRPAARGQVDRSPPPAAAGPAG